MANAYETGIDRLKGRVLGFHTQYGNREPATKSQLETYHHNKHIDEILQQRFHSSHHADFAETVGNPSFDISLIEANSNPTIWKSDHLRNQYAHNQPLILIDQPADITRMNTSSQINWSNDKLYQHPLIHSPTISGVSHVWNPQSHGPESIQHHIQAANPGLVQQVNPLYSCHKTQSNRHDKRGAAEALLLRTSRGCSNTDEDYFGMVSKRPRLCQDISALPVNSKSQFHLKCYRPAGGYNSSKLQTVPQTSLHGKVISKVRTNHHNGVSPYQSLSNLARNTRNPPNLKEDQYHVGLNRAGNREKHLSPTSQNRHPLARHNMRAPQIPLQRQPAYLRSINVPSDLDMPSQRSSKHVSISLRKREGSKESFVVSEKKFGDQSEVAGARNDSAQINGDSFKYYQSNILFQALTSSKKTYEQISGPSVLNASTYLTNNDSIYQSNSCNEFRPTLQSRLDMINKRPRKIIPIHLPTIQQAETVHEQCHYPMTALLKKDHDKDDTNSVIAARGPVVSKTTQGKAKNPSKRLHKIAQKTNAKDRCFNNIMQNQLQSSGSNVSTLDSMSKDTSEINHQKQIEKQCCRSGDSSNARKILSEDAQFLKSFLQKSEELKMSYGTFLHEVVVPMTLSISQQNSCRQKSLRSIWEVWQKQRNFLSFDTKLEAKVVDKNDGIKVDTQKKTSATEELRMTEPKKEFTSDFNREKQFIPGESNITSTKKGVDSCTVTAENNVSDSNKQITVNQSKEMPVKDLKETIPVATPSEDSHLEDSAKPEAKGDQITLSKETLSKLPTRKSVRVVLKSSDRIKLKFYSVDTNKGTPCATDGEGKNRTTERKIMMRIGSEKLFTRSYRSEIPSKKTLPLKSKKKSHRRKKNATSVSKEFTRIALSVHKTSGETALHKIVRLNAKSVLKYCLDGRFHNGVNLEDHAGYTPLHECCVFGRLWIAEQLILNGADVNASAQDGTRPLHDAVENGYTQLVRLLLAHGADPLIPTYAKLTAFDKAKSESMRKLLLDYLTDINGASEDLSRNLKLTTSGSTSTIRFRRSCSIQESSSWERTFVDTSSLDELDTSAAHNPMLYLRESPQPDHFRLQLKEDERVKTWYLLVDVLSRLSIPSVTFPYLYPHIKVHGLPTDIFLKKVHRAKCKLQFHHTQMCASKEVIEFVEADDEVSAILQLERWTYQMNI